MFPASAGMIPRNRTGNPNLLNVPRKRGDDPAQARLATAQGTMFPASAGMIPNTLFQLQIRCNVPRTRGDDPSVNSR